MESRERWICPVVYELAYLLFGDAYAKGKYPRKGAERASTLEGTPNGGDGAPRRGACRLSVAVSAGRADLRLLKGNASSVFSTE